jgi:hypothetical protein
MELDSMHPTAAAAAAAASPMSATWRHGNGTMSSTASLAQTQPLQGVAKLVELVEDCPAAVCGSWHNRLLQRWAQISVAKLGCMHRPSDDMFVVAAKLSKSDADAVKV